MKSHTNALINETSPLNLIRAELEQAYDSDNGGFGKAPKFPHMSNIECLMQHYYLSSQDLIATLN